MFKISILMMLFVMGACSTYKGDRTVAQAKMSTEGGDVGNPKKISELPELTQRTKTYHSDNKGALDTLVFINSKEEGPFILKLCATKNHVGAGLLYGDLLIYQVNDQVIIDNEAVNELKNIKRGDFIFCKDTEFASAKDLAGKHILISAMGAGRDYYVAIFPNGKPEKALLPFLITTGPGQTRIALKIFDPFAE
jgi:hypothetical protein